MNKHVSTYRILKLIQGARIKKKLKIYRRVFGVLFDKVTTFYSLIVLGYVIIAFFIFDDYFSNHDYLFLTIEQQANRSEENTSELQSHIHIICSILLEN